VYQDLWESFHSHSPLVLCYFVHSQRQAFGSYLHSTWRPVSLDGLLSILCRSIISTTRSIPTKPDRDLCYDLWCRGNHYSLLWCHCRFQSTELIVVVNDIIFTPHTRDDVPDCRYHPFTVLYTFSSSCNHQILIGIS
jgi:hypothetical protein